MGNTANEHYRIVIASGGTGGHLFPGIAIAEAFREASPLHEILFVGTGKPLETRALATAGFPLECIAAEGLKGRGIRKQMGALFTLQKGVRQATRILKRFAPHLVIGMGSYSAAPVVLAAWPRRIKTVLHEQNMLPGMTNRFLSRLADRVYVSFEKSGAHFDSAKVRVTGNPIRRDLIAIADENSPRPLSADSSRPFSILIIGGSQGAHGINLAVMDALQHLDRAESFRFVHQTGEQDLSAVREAYARQGCDATIQPFFDDMGRRYQAADLIVCRAGATTVAEVTAIGKGVLFIPFPFAADNHQEVNAQVLVDAGAAEMILEKELNGRILAEKWMAYRSRPEILETMASRARTFGRPQAAREIVDDCCRMLRGE